MLANTLIAQANLTTREVADGLGISYLAAWRKVQGERRFQLHELPLLARLLSEKFGRSVTVDELLQTAA